MLKRFLFSFLLIAVFIPVTVANAADIPDLGEVSKSLVFKEFDSDSDCDYYLYELNTLDSDAIIETYLRVLLSDKYSFRQVGHEVKRVGSKDDFSMDDWKFAYTGSKNVSTDSNYSMKLTRIRFNWRGKTSFIIALAHGLTYPGDYKPATSGSNYSKKECPECRGSGRCKECGGSGRVDKWGGDRTYYNLTCTRCAGSGKCRDCGGSGKR